MAGEIWKTQTWWSLPVYTGDVSGVCSALYELGGMVVMHDPSGCNSTYNTHDEIRWSSSQSLIFLSGLTQRDAITGNDQKLIDDITDAARQYHPSFIAVAGSPVPWLIGTDMAAVCRKVSSQTQIPAFHVETNAMHDYTRGAGQAFLKLAVMLLSGKERPTEPESTQNNDAKRRIRVNLLGMTPLDFTILREADLIRKKLENNGFEVVSVWAIGDRLENLKQSLRADVNLVVSSAGIYAARWMEETFHIPYTAGIPVGEYSDVLYRALQDCAYNQKCTIPYLEIIEKGQALSGSGKSRENVHRRCIAGEPVTMGSVAADRILTDKSGCDLIPLTETVQGLIPKGSMPPAGERQIREAFGPYDYVIADPMLRAACADGCRFEALPHLALSGRMYLDRIKPLTI